MASLASKVLSDIGDETGMDFLGEWKSAEDKFYEDTMGSASASDWFSPQLPEVETPDPVAQQAALPTAQAMERSLINRAGLQTTKKVQQSLFRQRGRQTLGGTSV